MRHLHWVTIQPAAVACAAALVWLTAPGAAAQVAGQDPQQEIKQLFKKIEGDLQEIDKLLNQAAHESKGGASAAESADPKAAAKGAHDKQKEVSESIQKIIDLIPPGSGTCPNGNNHGLKKPGDNPNGGKGQQNSQNPGGKKPQDSAQGPAKDEQTAKNAGQAIAEPQGQKPPGGNNPEDNRKSNEPPQMGKGKPREYDTERQNRAKEGTDRWGDLPEHKRAIFENTNTEDLPMRYRKWIQEFYLRMQKPTTGNK